MLETRFSSVAELKLPLEIPETARIEPGNTAESRYECPNVHIDRRGVFIPIGEEQRDSAS
jgi:hypothetical protein